MMSQSIASYELRECVIACASFASGEIHFYPNFLELYVADHYANYSSPLQLDYVDFAHFKASRESGSLRMAIPHACITPWAEVNQCASQIQPDTSTTACTTRSRAAVSACVPTASAGRPHPDTTPVHDGAEEETTLCYLLLRLLPDDVPHFFEIISGTLATYFRTSRSASRMSVAALPLRLSAPSSAHPFGPIPAEQDDHDFSTEGCDASREPEDEETTGSRASSMGSHITTRMLWQRRTLTGAGVEAAASLLDDGEGNTGEHGEHDGGDEGASVEAPESVEEVRLREDPDAPEVEAETTPTNDAKCIAHRAPSSFSSSSTHPTQTSHHGDTKRAARGPPSPSLSAQLATLARDALDPPHWHRTIASSTEDAPRETTGQQATRPSTPPVALLRRRADRGTALRHVATTSRRQRSTKMVASATAARDITDEILAAFQPSAQPRERRPRRRRRADTSTRPATPSPDPPSSPPVRVVTRSVRVDRRSTPPHHARAPLDHSGAQSHSPPLRRGRRRRGQARLCASEEPVPYARIEAPACAAEPAVQRRRLPPSPVQPVRAALLASVTPPHNDDARQSSSTSSSPATPASCAHAPRPHSKPTQRYSQDELRGRALTILMEDEPTAALAPVTDSPVAAEAAGPLSPVDEVTRKDDADEKSADAASTLVGAFLCLPSAAVAPLAATSHPVRRRKRPRPLVDEAAAEPHDSPAALAAVAPTTQTPTRSPPATTCTGRAVARGLPSAATTTTTTAASAGAVHVRVVDAACGFQPTTVPTTPADSVIASAPSRTLQAAAAKAVSHVRALRKALQLAYRHAREVDHLLSDALARAPSAAKEHANMP